MFTIFPFSCQCNLQKRGNDINMIHKNEKMKTTNRKRESFWHFGIWISFGIWILAFGLDINTSWGTVRHSAISGSWYPGSADELRSQVEYFLNNVRLPKLPEKISGLIVPHAGYRYSGQTAAYAFKVIKGHDYKRVVILAPSHYAYFYGASTFNVDYYETPLGLVPVDKEVGKALLNEPLFKEQTMTHLREHAIEIELPFLQMVLKRFKLVPILVGHIDEKGLINLVNSIKKILGKDISNTLFIASSDFTHFGPMYGYMPFTKDIPENIKKLDMGAVDFILKGNVKGLLKYAKEKNATICGLYPIATLLSILPKQVKGYLLHYTTSGEILGDYKNSVSYTAIALAEKENTYKENNYKINVKEKEALLKLARFTIDYYFDHGCLPASNEVPIKITPALKMKKGVFVTLKKYGDLRGCIGFIESYFALYETVMRAALQAAFADPRFPPLRREELKEINIEISVLNPPILTDNINEIKIGRDGLIIKKKEDQGLLLPQVATELRLDRIKFLELTCRKAGLLPSAWKEGALIFRFSASVFSEENIK